MKQADPFDRTALEVRILSHLNDFHHPVTWDEFLATMTQDSKEAVVCKTVDLQDEGLVTIRSLKGDGKLIGITPEGKNILIGIYNGRGSCS